MIAIITYNHPHRKTQDVIFGLKALGYQNVALLALPFQQYRNPFQPLYQHRPTECLNIYPKQLAANFGYNFEHVTTDNLGEYLKKILPEATLIAGAGILPSKVVSNHRIINSHPAYLPEVRGLDALKWAIHLQKTIGVTTHFINENADAGLLIDKKKIPVYTNDTLHSLAYRQYRTEIEMLLNSIETIRKSSNFQSLSQDGEVHRRMPHNIEKNLLTDFENYKIKLAINI